MNRGIGRPQQRAEASIVELPLARPVRLWYRRISRVIKTQL